MPTRLTLKDSKMFPIQAFFNAIGDSSFIEMVDYLTRRVGYSINVAHVRFPTDLDPDEEPFEGVRFSIYEDNIVIPISKLKEILQQLVLDFERSHPDSKDELARLIARL